MMMVRKSKGLGERHQRILEFLQVYQHENKYPPSIREIGEKDRDYIYFCCELLS